VVNDEYDFVRVKRKVSNSHPAAVPMLDVAPTSSSSMSFSSLFSQAILGAARIENLEKKQHNKS